jgi:cellobiose phosphorylase
VDWEFEEGIRLNLTGQVFTTMFGLATDEQVLESYKSCQKYLKDVETGGYKLNTPLGPNTLNFGRGFSFAYGEKENGATFSHMVVMYMNALYQRGFVDQAYEVFNSIYKLCMENPNSTIYPGIPEYFNLSGKGMYSYLTGSASWLFLTVLTEMYGVKGDLGNLCLEPNLTLEQFDSEGQATVSTSFANRDITVTYTNPKKLHYTDYKLESVMINTLQVDPEVAENKKIILSREMIQSYPTSDKLDIIVQLG